MARRPLTGIKSIAIRICLVITDIVMPKMTGVELAEAVWALDRRKPVLLISAYSGFGGTDPRARKFAFLQKPFLGADLLRAVRDVLTGAERIVQVARPL